MDLAEENTRARQMRRWRWVERHGCPELLGELAAGRLSFRAALRIARLPEHQQRRELATREGRIRVQELAAEVINQFLSQQVQQPDTIVLGALCSAITEFIQASSPGP